MADMKDNGNDPVDEQRIFRELPGFFADTLVVFLGVWAFYSQILSATAASFDVLLDNIWIPALLVVPLSWWLWAHRPVSVTAPAADDIGIPVPLPFSGFFMLLVMLVPIAIGFYNGWGWFLWVSCALYFGLLVYWSPGVNRRIYAADISASHSDWVALLAFFFIAACISLVFSRANHDDGYYLNAIVSSMDHSHLPVLSFDGMHDNLDLPNHLITQKRQTYELLIAAVASLTGIAAWAVYYLVAPVFFAAFIGVANWLLLKRWLGTHAWLALLFVLGILLVWDAGGRSFGVWSLTMLYPGKVVMLTVLIPLIIHYSFSLIEAPTARSWLLLLLAQSAALSVSSSGSYVGALATLLVLLASFGRNRDWVRVALLASLALFPNGLILLLNWLDIQSIGGLGSEGKTFGPAVLFGQNIRGMAAFVAFVSVPLLARLINSESTVWLIRYVAIATLIIFNPLVIDILEVLASLLTWRTMWAVPVPALLAVGAIFSLAALRQPAGRTKARPAALAALVFAGLMALFVLADKPTIAGQGVFVALGKPKVHQAALEYAQYIQQLTDEDDLVLAPMEIAVVLAGMNGAPRQVIVRPLYIDHMRMYWSAEEADARKALQSYVQSGTDDPAQQALVVEHIRNRSIDVVTLLVNGTDQDEAFRSAMLAEGFSRQRDGAVEVWVRGK
jgi:hypothetical protein